VRIISLFNRGVSIPEIAAREGLSLKRMRNLVREILAKRMPRPPAEFLALPVSRLNEALLVSYSAMHTSVSGANFGAVDRVVRIVRELDRYHGFARHGGPARGPETPRLAAPSLTPLALECAISSDSEMALQPLKSLRTDSRPMVSRRRGAPAGASASTSSGLSRPLRGALRREGFGAKSAQKRT